MRSSEQSSSNTASDERASPPSPVPGPSTFATVDDGTDDEEETLLAVSIDSLRDENERLSVQNLDQAKEIEFLTTSLDSQRTKYAALKASFQKALKNEAQLQAELNVLRQQSPEIDNEYASLQRDNQRLQHACQQLEEKNRQLESQKLGQKLKMEALERFATEDDPSSQSSSDSSSDGAQYNRIKRKVELQYRSKIAGMAEQIDYLRRNSEDLQRSATSRQAEISKLQHQNATFREQVREEERTTSGTDGIIQALEAERDSMIQEVDELRSSQFKLASILGQGLTPRLILMLLSDKRHPRLPLDVIPTQSKFRQSYKIEDLEPAFLDVALSRRQQLTAFCESIADGGPGREMLSSISFSECSKCKVSRISSTQKQTQRGWFSRSIIRVKGKLDEYPSHFREKVCSNIPICSLCFGEAVKTTFANRWWYDLQAPLKLECPMENCQRHVAGRNIAQALLDLSEDQREQFPPM
jgi:myosin heavy subunit